MPATVRDLGRLLQNQIADLSQKIAGLDTELRRRAGTDDAARLTTIPGIGPITAAAITTFAPPMETSSKGRDFAAWVGLTPEQHSSGGKERLGRTSKMLVAVALANRMAQTAWALMRKSEDYRGPAMATA